MVPNTPKGPGWNSKGGKKRDDERNADPGGKEQRGLTYKGGKRKYRLELAKLGVPRDNTDNTKRERGGQKT